MTRKAADPALTANPTGEEQAGQAPAGHQHDTHDHAQHQPGHLCMPQDSRKKASRRLAIARGHIESIQRMLDDPDVYCVDVLRQIKAVQGALAGAGEVVLRGHLEAHVATAAARGDEAEIVDELMEVFKYT